MKIKGLILTACALTLLSFPVSAEVPATGVAGLNAIHGMIESDRTKHADVYRALAQLRAEMPELDRMKRGRYAITGRMVEALGPEAIFAAVDDLLRDAPFEKARPSVRRGWRVGLLYALGRTRDQRLRPVFEQVIRGDEDMEVVRVAAQAMAKSMDDDSAKTLVILAAGTSARSEAVLGGMGHCRRVSIANFLGERLKSANATQAAVLIQSLRDVGNSWAWKTPVVAASGEGVETRNSAARALVEAFLRLPEEQDEIAKALLIVDAPVTLALLIQAEKSADATTKLRVEKMRKKLSANPLRK